MCNYNRLASEIIEHVKSLRPTCDRCTSMTYETAETYVSLRDLIVSDVPIRGLHAREVINAMADSGFEHDILAERFTRRCSECQGAKLHPWAEKLEVDRVAGMLEHTSCHDLGERLDELLMRTLSIAPNDAVPATARPPEPRGFEFL